MTLTDASLYDHYKDSVAVKDAAVKERNRFFALTLLSVCILCLYAYDPILLESVAASWFAQYGIEVIVSGFVLQSALWIVVLYVYMRYLQAVVTVERTYLYLRKLESDLSFANREGEDYDALWGGLSSFIDFLYKRFFIAVVLISLLLKTASEWGSPFPYISIDCVCLVVVYVLSILYWVFLQKVKALVSREFSNPEQKA